MVELQAGVETAPKTFKKRFINTARQLGYLAIIPGIFGAVYLLFGPHALPVAIGILGFIVFTILGAFSQSSKIAFQVGLVGGLSSGFFTYLITR